MAFIPFPAEVPETITGLTEKLIPVGADELIIADSEDSNSSKKIKVSNISSVPLLPKGGLITSDGSNNGELAVGADGQVLVADSAEVSGLKWAAASGGGYAYSQSSPYSNTNLTTGSAWADVPNLTVTITTGSNPVIIRAVGGYNATIGDAPVQGAGVFGGTNSSTASAGYRIVRDGTFVVMEGRTDSFFDYAPDKIQGVDTPTAGSHTYKVQVYTYSSNGFYFNDIRLGVLY